MAITYSGTYSLLTAVDNWNWIAQHLVVKYPRKWLFGRLIVHFCSIVVVLSMLFYHTIISHSFGTVPTLICPTMANIFYFWWVFNEFIQKAVPKYFKHIWNDAHKGIECKLLPIVQRQSCYSHLVSFCGRYFGDTFGRYFLRRYFAAPVQTCVSIYSDKQPFSTTVEWQSSCVACIAAEIMFRHLCVWLFNLLKTVLCGFATARIWSVYPPSVKSDLFRKPSFLEIPHPLFAGLYDYISAQLSVICVCLSEKCCNFAWKYSAINKRRHGYMMDCFANRSKC